jgi:tRNA (cmo5U34)-methyltransferase
METDRVFAEKKETTRPFEFNEEVAKVFDDMLVRSVPLYQESIKRQSQLALEFYQAGSRIYDLGCSHGNLGQMILDRFRTRRFSMVAVDSSLPMIKKYKTRLEVMPDASAIKLVCGFLEDILIQNASVVLINLTLQFLKPEKREDLITRIYQGMNPGGILLLTEKTIHPVPRMDALQIQAYKAFKLENGYSELEISQKREALEKVLLPDSLEIHRQRLLNAGFSIVETWLQWFNFASILAIKT